MAKGNPYAHRIRTTQAELEYLVATLGALARNRAGLERARLELELVDGRVQAQIMDVRLAVPLAASGDDAPAALRALVDECERVYVERAGSRSRRGAQHKRKRGEPDAS